MLTDILFIVYTLPPDFFLPFSSRNGLLSRDKFYFRINETYLKKHLALKIKTHLNRVLHTYWELFWIAINYVELCQYVFRGVPSKPSKETRCDFFRDWNSLVILFEICIQRVTKKPKLMRKIENARKKQTESRCERSLCGIQSEFD